MNHHPKSELSQYFIPFTILIVIVIAAASQTEIAHYTSTELKYDQPYFTFWLTHSTFTWIFPIHLVVLKILRPGVPITTYLGGIKSVIAAQLGHSDSQSVSWNDIIIKWLYRVTYLTVLVSLPALSWFIAMSYTTSMDVTSIYATSSFHAYFFSMVFLGTPLSRLTVGSICLAFGGVVCIALSGDGSGDGSGEGEGGGGGASNRFFGDLVMMVGAVVLGLYEVVYKLVLPEGEGGVTSKHGYSPLPLAHGPTTPPDSRPLTPNLPEQSTPTSTRGRTSPNVSTISIPIPLTPTTARRSSSVPLIRSPHHRASNAPPTTLPTALHANFLTSCLGLMTFLLLWIPIPFLHYLGVEGFRWPGGLERGTEIWAGLAVVAWGGAFYNAGLMVLIGIWGPTTSSVANLLTIGLVAIIDALWLGQIPNLQTILGVGMICIGFGVLLWEGEG